MKLRINGNSVRIRLLEEELEILYKNREITERVQFKDGNWFEYGVFIVDEPEIDSTFENFLIRIPIPSKEIELWRSQRDFSFRRSEMISQDMTLNILIEKELGCIHSDKKTRNAE